MTSGYVTPSTATVTTSQLSYVDPSMLLNFYWHLFRAWKSDFLFYIDCEPTMIIYLQQPAIDVLKEIETFLAANPSEIVTIFIEDYVTSPQGLTKVFNASGLGIYWFPVSKMPKNGEDWPTVDEMVQQNQRLVVFTSKSSKEATEGIAYNWKYVVENQCKFHLHAPSKSIIIN